ncbi:MAG TPA: ribosome silencing factor [Bacteroidales bacterium]|nr:ribosome silencing factor [Bacteroidales bacterium]
MPVKRKKAEKPDIAECIAKGMIEKKAKNIVSIDFSTLQNTLFSRFVICHGTSRTQVEAIADAVEEMVRKTTGQKPLHREGFQNAEWILLDYFDVVAHIFQEKYRNFYKLEDLWADAEIKYIDSEK